MPMYAAGCESRASESTEPYMIRARDVMQHGANKQALALGDDVGTMMAPVVLICLMSLRVFDS